ncbi:MAG: hypothetical protein PHX47_03900 [Candidatus ainarchaeum sp.]|nr:hypothetical protein [Candidatus ainarchaeum sp.]
MARFKNTLKKLLPDRLRYGKGYVLENKMSKVSTSYNIKEYNINYLKEVNNFYKTFKLDSKKYSLSKTNFKALRNKDSRELVVRGVYSLFKSFNVSDEFILRRFPNKTKKERELIKNKLYNQKYPKLASQVIESINLFLKTRKQEMQPRYLEKFAEIFYELNLLKEKENLRIEGNKFFLEVFNKLNEITKQESNSQKINNSTPAYDYLSSISGDFIEFVIRSRSNNKNKYVTVKEFKKEQFSLDRIKKYTVR